MDVGWSAGWKSRQYSWSSGRADRLSSIVKESELRPGKEQARTGSPLSRGSQKNSETCMQCSSLLALCVVLLSFLPSVPNENVHFNAMPLVGFRFNIRR